MVLVRVLSSRHGAPPVAPRARGRPPRARSGSSSGRFARRDQRAEAARTRVVAPSSRSEAATRPRIDGADPHASRQTA